MASWGSLGHVTVAEPGALIGFLGPRVYEALYGRPFPEGVQTAENLFARGIIDGVVAPEDVQDLLGRALDILMAPRVGVATVPAPPDEPMPDVDTWDAVTRSRRPDRPGVRRLLRYAASDAIPLNGTGQGEADPGAADRAGAVRRRAVRVPRPGPPRPDARPADGSRGAARGAARDAPGRGARPAARHGHRHPGRGAVGRRRERRAGRRDRPLPVRPRVAAGADAVPDARRGLRRRRTRAAAGRPGGRGPARLAVAAAAGGRVGDRAPRHRRTRPTWPAPSGCAPSTSTRSASSTGSWPSCPTPPTSPRRSACGSAPCSSTSSPSCSPAARRRPAERAARYL